MTESEFDVDPVFGFPKFLIRKPTTNPVRGSVMKTPGMVTKAMAPEAATAGADEAKAHKVKAKPNGAAKAAPKAAKADKAKAKAAPVKAKGKAERKERTVDPTKLDQFGFRLTSMKSKAAALYAAKGGATLGEVKEALESTQFNVLTELKEKGFTVDTKQEDGEGSRKVTRYFVKAKAKK